MRYTLTYLRRHGSISAVCIVVAACAGTTTQMGGVSRESVKAEQLTQQRYAVTLGLTRKNGRVSVRNYAASHCCSSYAAGLR